MMAHPKIRFSHDSGCGLLVPTADAGPKQVAENHYFLRAV